MQTGVTGKEEAPEVYSRDGFTSTSASRTSGRGKHQLGAIKAEEASLGRSNNVGNTQYRRALHALTSASVYVPYKMHASRTQEANPASQHLQGNEEDDAIFGKARSSPDEQQHVWKNDLDPVVATSSAKATALRGLDTLFGATGTNLARRALQALGDSNIPDEPSNSEDWFIAVNGLLLAHQASHQATKAAQLIGQPGQQEAAEAAESLGKEAAEQARAVLYAGFGAVARAVSGAGEQAKIAGHMAGMDAFYLAEQAANMSAMYYGQAAAAVGVCLASSEQITYTPSQGDADPWS
ncbi:hypothetical protein WJX74_007741 [Apatococcus lobatus]|uniref:Uncharacterized protein n=1 Tax=Apatococcus lobatus TaxID=904363 RepID=A0AAW1QHZ7_9CHLO